MNREQLKDYNFKGDTFNPKIVREQVQALDERKKNDKPVQFLAKAVYITKFWDHIEGESKRLDTKDILPVDRIEVNKLKPALSTYLANLYPKRMKVILGHSPYTVGDPKKAEILMNHWQNKPVNRQRGMLAIRQALLYKGAGSKVGYDPAEKGLNRVWQRVFPYWELLLDVDAHDWDDARFIGHISWQPLTEVSVKYGLEEENLKGEARKDFLASASESKSTSTPSEKTADSDITGFIRVLEFCNLRDYYVDDKGNRYKGRLEIYVLDQADNNMKLVSMGPLPLVNGLGEPIPHIIPLIFEYEPEYPFRGLAYSEQLLPQQKEINISRSFLLASGRKDARAWAARKGAFVSGQLEKLSQGIDGVVLEVNEDENAPSQTLRDLIIPLPASPVSSNILHSMSLAENDFSRSMTVSQNALGNAVKTSATEAMTLESHTQSEFGRHAEQRDIWLMKIIEAALAAYVASMRDNGDSEGGDKSHDKEGYEDEDIEKKIEEETSSEEFDELDEAFLGRRPLDEVVDARKKKSKERFDPTTIELFGPTKEKIEVTAEDLDSDFDIGFNEASRSPVSRMERRNNVLNLGDKLLGYLQIAGEQAGTAVGAAAKEVYISVWDMFELPPNLSWDYIMTEAEKMKKGNAVKQAAPEQAAPEQTPPQQAAPQQAAPQQAPSKEEVIAQLKQMEPVEALEAMTQIFAKTPKALEIIEKAKQASPEEQAQAVQVLIAAIEEG
tara:strand:- start:635 stop:2812 length:2178 start_codon:yes stop_codon:yes gene_type:complete